MRPPVGGPGAPWIRGSGPPSRIEVVGNIVYAAAGDELWIYDATDPLEPSVLGFYAASEDIDDIAVEGGWAYLLIGQEEQVIDVSDPSAPASVATISIPYSTGLEVYGNLLHAAGDQTVQKVVHLR